MWWRYWNFSYLLAFSCCSTQIIETLPRIMVHLSRKAYQDRRTNFGYVFLFIFICFVVVCRCFFSKCRSLFGNVFIYWISGFFYQNICGCVGFDLVVFVFHSACHGVVWCWINYRSCQKYELTFMKQTYAVVTTSGKHWRGVTYNSLLFSFLNFNEFVCEGFDLQHSETLTNGSVYHHH